MVYKQLFIYCNKSQTWLLYVHFRIYTNGTITYATTLYSKLKIMLFYVSFEILHQMLCY